MTDRFSLRKYQGSQNAPRLVRRITSGMLHCGMLHLTKEWAVLNCKRKNSGSLYILTYLPDRDG